MERGGSRGSGPGSSIACGLVQEFEHRFARKPRLFRAPGRVNVIGEHTDYNGGYAWRPPAKKRAALQFAN